MEGFNLNFPFFWPNYHLFLANWVWNNSRFSFYFHLLFKTLRNQIHKRPQEISKNSNITMSSMNFDFLASYLKNRDGAQNGYKKHPYK